VVVTVHIEMQYIIPRCVAVDGCGCWRWAGRCRTMRIPCSAAQFSRVVSTESSWRLGCSATGARRLNPRSSFRDDFRRRSWYLCQT